jgi:hypothetical protein
MTDIIHLTLAQHTIDKLVFDLRAGGSLHFALNEALQTLVVGMGVERGLIWQVDGDRLAISHEFSKSEETLKLVGTRLSPQESVSIILFFLTTFPDVTDIGVIEVSRASSEDNTWAPLFNISAEYEASLLVQLRSDVFNGFVAFQTKKPKPWSAEEIAAVAKVGALMSVLVKNQFDIVRMTTETTSLSVLVEVLSIFINQDAPISINAARAVSMIGEYLGFKQSRLYLYADGKLVCQEDGGKALDLVDNNNPYIDVFSSGRGRFVGEAYQEAAHLKDFGKDEGIIVPLLREEKPFGVFGVWERSKERSFHPSDRELALWFAAALSKCLSSMTLHRSFGH